MAFIPGTDNDDLLVGTLLDDAFDQLGYIPV